MMVWVTPKVEEKVIVEKQLTDEQVAELKAIFKLYDTSGDGELTVPEMTKALKKTGLDQDDIEKMFKEADVDGGGTIGFEEFKNDLSRTVPVVRVVGEVAVVCTFSRIVKLR